MIRQELADEPGPFDANVRKRGLRAIAEMVGETRTPRPGRPHGVKATRREDIKPSDFPPYWTNSLDDLMAAYREICAYTCFRIHPVTGARSVDHFAPKSKAWHKVYEWSNYRLACSRINSRKLAFEDVLDPFEIEHGWFQLELVGFQVIPSQELPGELQSSIRDTVARLGLDDFCAARASDAENYWANEISLQILERESPFVAAELRRQDRLNLGDA